MLLVITSNISFFAVMLNAAYTKTDDVVVCCITVHDNCCECVMSVLLA